jgi:hypothetical protein
MNCRSFLVVGVMVALSLVATRAQARRGESRTREDENAQVRELLAKLAAASAEAAPEEKTDADLMYEAMVRWNGEPAGSAAIDRLLVQSGKDAERAKRATQERIRAMFWRDPFSDDPHRLIPVRQQDRELLASYGQKPRRRGAAAGGDSEVSRLRAELAAARADAEAARAEAARVRGQTESAMTTEKAGCYADESANVSVAKRVRRRSSRAQSRHRSQPPPVAVAAAPAREEKPTPTSTRPPWTVGGPNGIIVVPLESPPPPAPATVGRRARR